MNSNDLTNHLKDIHKKIKSECPSCNSHFSSERALLEHKKVVHDKNARIQCEEYDLYFSKRSHMQRHLKEIHCDTDKNLDFIENYKLFISYTCKECNQRFDRKENLTRHMGTVHTDNDEKKKFLCQQCPSKFSRKDNLKFHMSKKTW